MKSSRALSNTIVSVVFFVAIVVGSALFMPGAGGEEGTPGAILFRGFVVGVIGSLISAGIILIYRMSRVINFAQASIGAAGGVFTYNLAVAETTNWPYLLAFVAGVVVAAALGAVVEVGFVRRFFNSPRLVLTVLTIALVPALGFANGFVQGLPIFGDIEDRSDEQLRGQVEVDLPLSNFKFTIGDSPLEFGFSHLFAIGIALLALLALAGFFRFTRAGVAVRASAENTDRALLLGINVKGLSTLVWMIAGALSGIAIILDGTVLGFTNLAGGGNNAEAAAGVIIISLAAAVVAGMRSLPIATLATVSLAMFREAFRFSFREQLYLVDAFLFFLILLALLLQRKTIQRSEETEASSWQASEEVRPVPKEMNEITGVRIWRRVLQGLGILAVLIYPWTAAPRQINLASYLAIIGIVMLSIVVLTGWAGQVSLGQFAITAVGALLGGAMTAKWDWSFWLAIPATIVATSIVAIVIGLPALRIKGMFLAIVTFAFAFAVQTNLFEPDLFGWLLPGAVERPELFIFDFQDERSMYYLALIAFVLCILLVTGLRRTRPGRILIALRENEANVQSFGVNVLRTRLSAFALAGALCGFAGVLLAHHQRGVTGTSFPATDSLFLFIYTVIGGIGSVSGAILGAIYYALVRIYGDNQLLQLVIGPVGLLLLLYIAPGGISSLVFGLRDGILRIIAQRRRMIVPSLFADVDPDAVERNVAPLAEPLPNVGLAALRFDQRYRGESRLYANRGRLAALTRRRRVDAEAFGAAADNVEEIAAGAEDAAARASAEAGKVAAEIAAGPTEGTQ